MEHLKHFKENFFFMYRETNILLRNNRDRNVNSLECECVNEEERPGDFEPCRGSTSASNGRFWRVDA